MQSELDRHDRRNARNTFAVNKGQPIGRYVIIAQRIHSSDVWQPRHLVVFSWWECLGTYLVHVVDIQEARDDGGCASGRRSLRQTSQT